MAEELSRVTIVGTHKRVDLAVPSATPVGEFTGRLATLCGQDRDPMQPAAWSLAVAGDPALPLDSSLSDMQINDGQVLYLRDLNREPTEAPMVEDIEELVANETLEIRRRMVWRGPATLAFGLLWMVGAAGWLAARSAAGSSAAIGLVIVALLLIGLAWALGQQKMALSRPSRLAVALTSVPCLGAAGGLVAIGLAGPGARWPGVVIGATVGALMALAALAEPLLAVVALHLTLAAGVVAILVAVGATKVPGAAFVVLVSAGLFALVRRTAAIMTSWASRVMRTRSAAAAAAPALVHETGWLLVLLLGLPAVASTVALPILAASGKVFASALAVVATIGLLARSYLASFTAEMLCYLTPGLVGCFTLVIVAAGWLGLPPAAYAAVLLVGGLAVVGVGVLTSLFGPNDPTAPSQTRPPRRRLRAEILNTLCNVAIVPLAMGAFGVLSDLVEFGRNLF